MKTLAVFAAVHHNFQTSRSGKANLIFQIALFLVGLTFLYFAFSLNQTADALNTTATLNHATTALDLSAEAVAKTVTGVRNSLSLLARLPVLRQIKQAGHLNNEMTAIEQDLRLLLDSYEQVIARIFAQVHRAHNNLQYWGEMPMALYRRIAMGVGLLHEYEDEDNDYLLFKKSSPALQQMRKQTAMARSVTDKIADLAYALTDSWRTVSLFMDKLGMSNRSTAEDVPAIENLFAMSLNDNLLKALVLKSLHGGVIAQVGEGIAANLSHDSRDCDAIVNGSPFFCGPVAYDKIGKRAVWWVAVPVRDEKRLPVACLAALIDLSFLDTLATKFKEGIGFAMIFTDQHHVIIGNSKPQLVAEQAALSVLPTREAAKNVPWRVLDGPDGRYLQAIRNLKNGDYRYLPHWKIFINAQLQLTGRPGQFILPVCVILLAAAGLYVLSCCVVRIFNIVNGES